ncbi:MAG: cysteine hydrolase, partial [Aestuariivirga sp.]|nr:cysteine hydrolase [Aestuariivirga sp.]
ARLVPELQPLGDEIVVTKTADSALTGTNLRLILHNLGIKTVICCGIFTDQCVSSAVRSLADESDAELEIINMIYFHIYCHVMTMERQRSQVFRCLSPGRHGACIFSLLTGIGSLFTRMKIWCSIRCGTSNRKIA